MELQRQQRQRQQQQSEQLKSGSVRGALGLGDRTQFQGRGAGSGPHFFEFEDLVRAYRKCARGKRRSQDSHVFEAHLGRELVSLYRELKSHTWRPGQNRCFVVTSPRVREIWAAPFRDRIVHHLIVEPLEQIWERRFHPKSFACRRGKGPFAALEDLNHQLRRISQGGQKSVWALQLDIESFFYTVDRRLLKPFFLERVPTC